MAQATRCPLPDLFGRAAGRLFAGLWVHPLLWLLVLPGSYVYMRQPYRRLAKLIQSCQQENNGKSYTMSELLYLA